MNRKNRKRRRMEPDPIEAEHNEAEDLETEGIELNPAEEAYAQYLEEHPERLFDNDSLMELAQEKPELHTQLMLIHRGGAALDSGAVLIRDDYRRRRVIRRVAAVAACALVCLSVLYYGWFRDRVSDRTADDTRILRQLSQLPGALLTPTQSKPDPLSQMEPEDRTALAALCADLIELSGGPHGSPLAEYDRLEISDNLDVVRDLRDSTNDVAVQFTSDVRTGVSTEPSPNLAFLIGEQLRGIPEESVTRLVEAAGSYESLSAHLQLALDRPVLSVRSIDLDAEGVEFQGAEVYLERARIMTAGLEPPEYVGETPLLAPVPAGDYRVRVFDRKTGRHSVLRTFLAPGRVTPPQVAFFRTIDPDAEGMVRIPAGPTLYGHPEWDRLHYSEQRIDLHEFWIGDAEVTYSEYDRFYDDVMQHPEWQLQDRIQLPIHFGDWDEFLVTYGNHAAPGIVWTDAVQYANWAGMQLPRDREWERAARGTEAENRTYPWGNDFRPSAVVVPNFPVVWNADRTLATIQIPLGKVNWGLARDPSVRDGVAVYRQDGVQREIWRLADNLSEWTEDLAVHSRQRSRPSDPDELFAYLLTSDFQRVVRGSDWLLASPEQCQVARRSPANPASSASDRGFRCVYLEGPTVSPDMSGE